MSECVSDQGKNQDKIRVSNLSILYKYSYSYTCKECPEVNKYTGETNRNFYTRDQEHRDKKNLKSWMRSHQNEKHEGNSPEYKMKVEKVFKDPLSRQAGKAVMIRRTEGNVLNSIYLLVLCIFCLCL